MKLNFTSKFINYKFPGHLLREKITMFIKELLVSSQLVNINN